MKIVSTYQDERFAREIIPKLIRLKINNNLNKCVQSKKDIKMRGYIGTRYGEEFDQIMKTLTCNENAFIINKNGKQYIVEINPNIIVKSSGLSLEFLVRMIDYGNLDVKGLHIVDSAMKYVQLMIDDIYRLYMKGGLSNSGN